MKVDELIKIIELEHKDVIDSSKQFLKRADNTEWKPSATLVNGVDEGLQTYETSYAIERKIITLREHLNRLRKGIVDWRGKKYDL